MNKDKKRNTSIELLRIAAMIMIIFHHFSVHGNLSIPAEIVIISRLWNNLMNICGKIGVDIFVMITGYFLIEDDECNINWNRLARLWGQIVFYSIAIFFFLIIVGEKNFNNREMIKSIFPILNSRWWFANTYVVLYLIHPFVNRLLKSLEKKEYQYFLLLLVIVWSIIPTFTMRTFEGNDLIWFVVLYSIAAYIKLFKSKAKYSSGKYIIWGVLLLLMTDLISFVCTILGERLNIFAIISNFFYGQEKVTTLLIAISFFYAAITATKTYNKWINLVGTSTFGIYLIHDHPEIRLLLWENVVKEVDRYSEFNIIGLSVIIVIGIFIICSIIDIIRKVTIEKIYMFLVNNYIYKLQSETCMLSGLMEIVFGGNNEKER